VSRQKSTSQAFRDQPGVQAGNVEALTLVITKPAEMALCQLPPRTLIPRFTGRSCSREKPGTLSEERNMSQQAHAEHTILRRPQVEAQCGYGRSTLYLRIAQGLWPRPVRLGARAVGWPASDVAAINGARIAGKSDDEIRDLVSRLQRGRQMAIGRRIGHE
jgi:prophage regulatory protein